MAGETPPQNDTPTEALPVRAVTLFSSGVAYTLREGEVEAGEASVALTFRTTQVNDLLKSLVLLDGGGTVRPAPSPSRDPVGRTLQSFAVDVTANRSRADLLRALRGAPVRVETVAGEALEGRVLGVEERQEVAAGDREVTVETVSLLTEEGLTAVDLPRVRLLRILDPHLDRELREALAVLASGSDDARRTVTLRFQGETRRTVRVGYVTEAPLWKVSYRLVLEDEEAGEGGQIREGGQSPTLYLQGWALVENTSDDDWNEVALSLVSGRPVSFIQDLYQPLYVPRPVVPPDIVASPFPQTHGGDMLAEEYEGPVGGAAFDMAMPAAAPPAAAMPMATLRKASGGGPAMESHAFARATSRDMQESVSAQAEGKTAGELFAYHVGTPVTLPRQQAAMIPILAGNIEGEKLSLYNADRDPRFPLNAVRLKNSTALHLKAGPLTVFDGGIYAGDARMEEIPPEDSRLITYAVDLAVEGERQTGMGTQSEATLAIRRGVLQITRRQRRHTIYTLKSKAQKARLVYVEHPFDSAWTLIEPEAPAERSAQFYRFAVRLNPGETKSLRVTTEQPVDQMIVLVDGGLNAIASYVSAGYVSQAIKDALAPVVEKRRRMQEIETQVQHQEAEITAIHAEQDRIRKNMGAVDKDSALYRRYVNELDSQETRLQTLREEAAALRAAAQEAERDLRAYVDSLEVES